MLVHSIPASCLFPTSKVVEPDSRSSAYLSLSTTTRPVDTVCNQNIAQFGVRLWKRKSRAGRKIEVTQTNPYPKDWNTFHWGGPPPQQAKRGRRIREGQSGRKWLNELEESKATLIINRRKPMSSIQVLIQFCLCFVAIFLSSSLVAAAVPLSPWSFFSPVPPSSPSQPAPAPSRLTLWLSLPGNHEVNHSTHPSQHPPHKINDQFANSPHHPGFLSNPRCNTVTERAVPASTYDA